MHVSIEHTAFLSSDEKYQAQNCRNNFLIAEKVGQKKWGQLSTKIGQKFETFWLKPFKSEELRRMWHMKKSKLNLKLNTEPVVVQRKKFLAEVTIDNEIKIQKTDGYQLGWDLPTPLFVWLRITQSGAAWVNTAELCSSWNGRGDLL